MLRTEQNARCASSGWVVPAGTILVLGVIGLESIPALAIVLMEGTVALGVLASAGLAGGWMARWLGMKDAPWAERLILGAGLGIGLLPLVVLGLGSLAWLNRVTAVLLVGGLAAAGVARLALDLREMGVFRPRGEPASGDPPVSSTPGAPPASLQWLWLLVCPFIAIMLLAACLPPGVLWREEGFGYDVLEYHLAVPKIFFEQGRISFLPNNVYSNFPLSGEMFSLLMMTLHGDPIEACFMAVTVDTGLAVLFMAAAWLAGRRFSARAGLIAGVLAGTTPWIAYLAGIVYVEVGMLALGTCALAAGLRGRALPAGVLAGLACGYKYTAVPLIAFPIAFLLLAGGASWPQRVRHLLLYGCSALIAFSPWIIRNTLNTGNPFFPLAYSVFGDRSGTWDDELHANWQKIHGTAAAEHADESLPARAWTLTGGDFRFGAAALILAAIGTVRRPDRWTAALLGMLAVQIVIWLTATHLFARFAVVMLLPVLVLAGRALGDEPSRDRKEQSHDRKGVDEGHGRARSLTVAALSTLGFRYAEALVLVLLLAGAGWNLYRLGNLYYDHTRAGGTAIGAYGQTAWFTTGQWPGMQHWGAINALPADARVMLVGEARTFYSRRPCDYAVVFNRQPLAEALDRMHEASEVIDWLRARGVTHLLVHWAEIGRLGSTYGFPPRLIDPGVYGMLVGAGLKETARFTYGPENPEPYATLFEVPRS